MQNNPEGLGRQTPEIDQEILKKQRALLKENNRRQIGPITPLTQVITPKTAPKHEHNVGCLILAGGQGTRLGFEGPKGCCPIGSKSLFQRHIEKIPNNQWHLPIAIMTSPLNHEATVSFFKKHTYFDYDPTLISFFTQSMLPFLNDDGDLFYEQPDQIAMGPNGNGYALRHFVESGLYEKWLSLGIDTIQVMLVDNFLAIPFDPILSTHHTGDITIQCIPREDPHENVGILVNENGHPTVIEYSEFPPDQKEARLPDGSLKYPLANISQLAFSMPFVKKAAKIDLPLHLAHKKAIHLGKPTLAWKFETFIFDLLPHANSVQALLCDRERCFAPLKTQEDLEKLSHQIA